MIRFSNEEGFIKPTGISFRDDQDKNIVLPKTAIGVFSMHLFEDVVSKFNCREVGIFRTANSERPIYVLTYKNVELTFFMAGVGGPFICADIEELHAQGVENVIIFGNCGVLDSTIEDCSIIIPTKAFRDEGSSYHYIEESDTIDLNPKYIDDFIEILDKYNFDYRKGYTWTTDAIYRETRDKMEYFKNNGAISVEMEGACIAAVCKRNNINYFTFYYAGDNLDAVEWEERSLNGLVNIDKKKEVMNLALKLSLKINNK